MDNRWAQTRLGKLLSLRGLPGIVLSEEGLSGGAIFKAIWRLLENIHTTLWIREELSSFVPAEWFRSSMNWNWVMFLIGMLWLSVVVWGDKIQFFLHRNDSQVRPLEKDDPRILIADLLEVGDYYFPSSPFLLRNDGATTAHRIQIEPFEIGYNRVTFEVIDHIEGGGGTGKAIPVVGQQCNTLFSTLRKEWDHKVKATGTKDEYIAITLTISYLDFRQKGYKFTTEVEVAYFPLRHEIRKKTLEKGGSDWPDVPSTIWKEFTHKPFKKIKLKEPVSI